MKILNLWISSFWKITWTRAIFLIRIIPTIVDSIAFEFSWNCVAWALEKFVTRKLHKYQEQEDNALVPQHYAFCFWSKNVEKMYARHSLSDLTVLRLVMAEEKATLGKLVRSLKSVIKGRKLFLIMLYTRP